VSIFSVSSPSVGTLNSNRSRLALLGALAAFSLFGTTGCYARVRAHPAVVTTYEYQEPVVYEEPVVYVQSAPVVDIETYPRTYYRGSYVYYVNGIWYTRGSRGWVYYRSEPRDLVSYRSSVEFQRHPRVSVTTRVEAPRVRVETPRVEAHVEAHGSVRAGTHPAKPKRRD